MRRVVVFALLIGSGALFALGTYALYTLESAMTRQHTEEVTHFVDGVRHGLHAVMLAGEARLAHEYFRHIRMVKSFSNLKVWDVSGREAFHGQPSQTGLPPDKIPPLPDKKSSQPDKKSPKDTAQSRDNNSAPRLPEQFWEIFQRTASLPFQEVTMGQRHDALSLDTQHASGERLRHYFIPLYNEPQCQTCHQDGQDLRGIFQATVSMADADRQIQQTKSAFFMITATTVLSFVLLLGIVLKRVLQQPLERLDGAIERVGSGNLTERVPEGRNNDEIARISRGFNRLSGNLEERIRLINLHSNNIVAFIREIITLRGTIHEDARILQSASQTASDKNALLSQEITTIEQLTHSAQHNIERITSGAATVSNNTDAMAHSLEQTFEQVHSVQALSKGMASRLNEARERVQDTNEAMASMVNASASLVASIDEVGIQSRNTEKAFKRGIKLVGEAQNRTDVLSQATQKITQVLEMVNQISDETNMLGLNAQIEAASAGDAGRGFALVASEVKELGGRTQHAGDIIHGILRDIQTEATEVSDVVEKVSHIFKDLDSANREILHAVSDQSQVMENLASDTDRVKASSEVITQTISTVGESFDDVMHAMDKADTRMGSISDEAHQAAEATHRMAKDSQEMARFLSNMADAAETTEKASQRVANSMHSLERVSREMNGAVSHFRALGKVAIYISDSLMASRSSLDVGPEPFDIIRLKGPFLSLLGQLERMVADVENVDAATLYSDCTLKDWIKGDGAIRFGDHPTFALLEETHAQLIKTLEEIVALIEDDRRDPEARLALRFFSELRRTLFDHLNHLYMGHHVLPDEGDLIPWNSAYETGNSTRDRSTKSLIESLNRLHESARNNLGGAMKERVAQFHTQMQNHVEQYKIFRTDEERESFHDFTTQMETFLELHSEDDFHLSKDMSLFLRNWVTRHALQPDIES